MRFIVHSRFGSVGIDDAPAGRWEGPPRPLAAEQSFVLSSLGTPSGSRSLPLHVLQPMKHPCENHRHGCPEAPGALSPAVSHPLTLSPQLQEMPDGPRPRANGGRKASKALRGIGTMSEPWP